MRTRATAAPTATPRARTPTTTEHPFLRLQRVAGNRAVAHLARRHDHLGAPIPSELVVDARSGPDSAADVPEAAVQRASASVSVDGRTSGSGESKKGGVGGSSHAEQKAWMAARGAAQAAAARAAQPGGDRQLSIRFVVDTKVCGPCQAWFTGALLTDVSRIATAAGVQPSVAVTVDDGRTYGSTAVTGAGTVWPRTVAE